MPHILVTTSNALPHLGLRRFAATVLGLLIFSFVSLPVFAQQKYSVTDLGTLGGDRSYGYGISSKGHVAGYSVNADGLERAFIWDKDTGMVEIPVPPTPNSAGTESYAFGVNSKGQVVGIYNDIIFLWDAVNGLRTIGMVSSFNSGLAVTGINDKGQISGTLGVPPPDYWHAYRWESSSGQRDLGTLPDTFVVDHPASVGAAINNNGWVVGGASVELAGRAFLWDGTGGLRNLGSLGGYVSFAFGVNDKGEVVGESLLEDNNSQHAFLWDNVRGMQDIGTPGEYSSAAAINNNSQVVGVSNQQPFLWHSSHGMKALNDLIPSDSGWVLGDARCINDNGQIVGSGIHGGQTRAFLLTPIVDPLIFIPGITGSTLRIRNNSELWLGGGGTDHSLLTLDPQKPQQDIIAADAFRNITLLGYPVEGYERLMNMLTSSGGYREYQVNNDDPVRRTTAGCDLSQKTGDSSQDPTLFVFAYDWRKSNADNAVLLKDYVGCVKKFYPDSKVNILTHSMGGLVARRYIIDNPSIHNLDKMVTIAAPWVGVPKAIFILETGKFSDLWIIDRLLGPTFKSLVEFFPSVHQLLPSRRYFDLGGNPFGEADGKLKWDINLNGLVDQNYSPEQLTDLLDNRQFVRSKPAQTGNAFHDKAGQDDWRSDQSGVRYYHIYGIQYYAATIGKILAIRKKEFDSEGEIIEVNSYSTLRVKGDGTVPRLSAERIGNGIDLNATNATKMPFMARSSREADQKLVEHTMLTQNPEVQNAILNVMNSGPPQIAYSPQPIVRPFEGKVSPKSQQGRKGFGHHAIQAEEGEAYYISVQNIEKITVTDATGNSSSQIDGTPFRTRLPGITIDEMSEVSSEIILPGEISANQSYVITFRSIGKPVELEITKGIGNAPETATQIIRYLDLNLPAGTALMLKVTPQGVENLRSDADGDGSFETTIAPTASAVGEAARDTEAPVVTFSEQQMQGTNRVIAISATDNYSGVKIIRYSLDGRKYQIYSTPISVNAGQTVTIYAIADDNVANRSDTFTHVVNASQLTTLGPAQVWVGLKNSDDVGTKFDLLAEVFKNGALIGSGQLNSVAGGSSGFNNAKLNAINMVLSGPTGFGAGDTLSIKLSIRIAATGHRSGTARLWLNDAAANSRFAATIGGASTTYFLRSGFALGDAAGSGPKNTIDVFADRAVGGNPFKPFGTWAKTF